MQYARARRTQLWYRLIIQIGVYARARGGNNGQTSADWAVIWKYIPIMGSLKEYLVICLRFFFGGDSVHSLLVSYINLIFNRGKYDFWIINKINSKKKVFFSDSFK